MLEEIRGAGELGIEVGFPALDVEKVQARKQKIVDKSARGIEYLFKKNKIEGIRGRGRLTGAHEVLVEGPEGDRMLRGKNILLATGSVPRDILLAPADGVKILNSDHVLELQQVPGSMAVLGAGAVGVEFASIYASFGTEVTLLEMLPRVLPIEDEDISKELERNLLKRGIKVLTGTRLDQVDSSGELLVLTATQGEKEMSLTADVLLIAVGRAPVSEDLGLEELGIRMNRGYLEVNEHMQSSVSHIYAIGDVVETPWLAHVASSEGVLAVEHMAGEAVQPINYDHVPSCTYCEPEVASVGLTEAEARSRGYDVVVGSFPFAALAKAAIMGKPEGFVKIVRETR